MNSLVRIAAIICCASITNAEAVQEYTQLLAERHAVTFPSVRSRMVSLAEDRLKPLFSSTELVIGSTGPFSKCGIQSMYSEYKDGHPVIVYCPTGYRIVHDFGEGYAYITAYITGAGLSPSGEVFVDFMSQYYNYLSRAAFSIISRDKNQSYPKLCDPLLYTYLYVRKLNPDDCASQVDKFKMALEWMYTDELDGAITQEKMDKNFGADFEYSIEKRRGFIREIRGQIQAGQWFGQLFHEFYHIANGHLLVAASSSAESADRELQADEFAIKMIVLDDSKSSMPRVVALTVTQMFNAALTGRDFNRRIQLSNSRTLESLKTMKSELPPELYESVMKMLGE